MNLFNVLKYPISDQPSACELEALPRDLCFVWLRASGWHLGGKINTVELSDYYHAYWDEGRNTAVHDDIILLRKMIAEYEQTRTAQCAQVSN